jgi:hypothetical protein
LVRFHCESPDFGSSFSSGPLTVRLFREDLLLGQSVITGNKPCFDVDNTTYVISTTFGNLVPTHVEVSAATTSAVFLDYMTLDDGAELQVQWGVPEDGMGWCLSTDELDIESFPTGSIPEGTCYRRLYFLVESLQVSTSSTGSTPSPVPSSSPTPVAQDPVTYIYWIPGFLLLLLCAIGRHYSENREEPHLEHDGEEGSPSSQEVGGGDPPPPSLAMGVIVPPTEGLDAPVASMVVVSSPIESFGIVVKRKPREEDDGTLVT